MEIIELNNLEDLKKEFEMCDFECLDDFPWEEISSDYYLTADFAYEFRYYINWDQFTCNPSCYEDDLLIKCKKYISWDCIDYTVGFSDEVLEECKDYLDWETLCQYYNFSKSQLRQFKDYLSWNAIGDVYGFTKEEIIEFAEYIPWREDYIYYIVNDEEDFNKIELYKSNLYYIIQNKTDFSKEFLFKYREDIDWWQAIKNQENIDMDLLYSVQDYINFDDIQECINNIKLTKEQIKRLEFLNSFGIEVV